MKKLLFIALIGLLYINTIQILSSETQSNNLINLQDYQSNFLELRDVFAPNGDFEQIVNTIKEKLELYENFSGLTQMDERKRDLKSAKSEAISFLGQKKKPTR